MQDIISKINGFDIPYVIDRIAEHYEGKACLDDGNIIVEYYDDDSHKSIVFSLAITVTKTEEFIEDCETWSRTWKCVNRKEYNNLTM